MYISVAKGLSSLCFPCCERNVPYLLSWIRVSFFFSLFLCYSLLCASSFCLLPSVDGTRVEADFFFLLLSACVEPPGLSSTCLLKIREKTYKKKHTHDNTPLLSLFFFLPCSHSESGLCTAFYYYYCSNSVEIPFPCFFFFAVVAASDDACFCRRRKTGTSSEGLRWPLFLFLFFSDFQSQDTIGSLVYCFFF